MQRLILSYSAFAGMTFPCLERLFGRKTPEWHAVLFPCLPDCNNIGSPPPLEYALIATVQGMHRQLGLILPIPRSLE